MSDQWQTERAQLSLDLMEARVAKAEVIKRLREVTAELTQAQSQHQQQLESCKEMTRSLQAKLGTSEADLTSTKSKIEQMYLEIADFQTALRHRCETEQTLRELLRSKENELMLKDQNSEEYVNALQREISQLSEDNRALGASLSSEQRAGSKARKDLETSQNQVIFLQGQIAKMKAEIGILKSNWQTERSRVLQLDDGQVASLIRDREQLQSRLDELERNLPSLESAKKTLSEKDLKIATLSKEISVLNAAIEAKNNIILELDSQLSTLQCQFQESSDHVQGQNKLIEDLYRRLKASEICGEQYPIVL